MSDKPNIYEPVSAICSLLDLGDPRNVRRLDITPTLVTAEVYELHDAGSKFVRDDGSAAIEIRTVEVAA